MPLKKEIFDRITEERMTKTQRLINRIKEVENFENLAFLCEDFDLSLIHI